MSLGYVIATHRGRAGVRLSKPGCWGNLPFESERLAREAAKADANGNPFSIELKHYTKPLQEVRP